ncbi:hypothetical protein [Tepidibacter hydrothermalis]|uniref:PASTA domain-containing protein n=1 Tax=Tepidibacter hydrothermalis TaxID=3036126 RepID=A0ABY8EIC9_9FIRM|nr:hypothetical protein [Tepidibacter hydrothermalis]WFD11710.1 hypothetical protein P4S50_06440 [Tepidibacter hydrothermalis]
MNYFELFGIELSKAKQVLENNDIKYIIKETIGRKDKSLLVCPRVINIKKRNDYIELVITYFSDSL